MLDTSTPSLNVDGVPVGENLANPMYWDDPELEREWKDFVLGPPAPPLPPHTHT